MTSPRRLQQAFVSLDRLLTPSRLRVYPLVLLCGFIIVWSVNLVSGRGELLPDFRARWTAGRIVLDGQVDRLYDPQLQATIQSKEIGTRGLSWFVSPPFVALLFVPFAVLPYSVAAAVWTLVGLGLFAVSLRLLQSMLQPSKEWWTQFVLIVAGSHPVLELFASGQDSSVVLFSMVLGLRLANNRRELAGGLALGLCLVKPQFALLLPIFFFLRRRWLALVGMSLAGVGASVLSLSLTGLQGASAWLAVPTSSLYAVHVQLGQAWKGVSLQALLTCLSPPSVAGTGHLVAIIVGLAFATWGVWIIHTRVFEGTAFALVLLTTLVASPHAMVYDLCVALPTFAFLLERKSSAPARVLSACCYTLLWIGPTLHLLTHSLPWPLVAAGAPWIAALLVAVWVVAARAWMK